MMSNPATDLWRRYVVVLMRHDHSHAAATELAWLKCKLGRTNDDVCTDRQIVISTQQLNARLRRGGSDDDRQSLMNLRQQTPALVAAVEAVEMERQ